jgi:hypothetical protein
MSSPDDISIIRELGVCKSGESGPLALLGAANHAAPYTSCCAKTRQYETNWLAHVSAYLFHTSSIYCRGAEGYAGTAASLNDSGDPRYVDAGGYNREAQCARSRGLALVPRKRTRNVGPAFGNTISCTYFVPFCAHTKMEHFR